MKKFLVLLSVPFLLNFLTSNKSSATFKTNSQIYYADTLDGFSNFSVSDFNYGKYSFVPSLTYSSNGIEYQTSCVVTYPSGKVTNASNILVSEAGLYSFNYVANVNGQVHSTTKTYLVPYPQYSISSFEKSSITYINEEQAKEYGAKTAGALVKLSYGDTLTFTEPVSVEDLTATNVLVKGYIIPNVVGSADFNQLIITISDINNPDIYVKEMYYSHTTTSSIMARSNLQNTYAGVHSSQGLHTNDTWGTWSGVSFIGTNNYKSNAPDECFFTAGFDYAEKRVYGTQYSKGEGMDGFVLDLDSSDHVTTPWDGFESDKVKISISCDGYSSSMATFVLTDFRSKGAEVVKENKFIDNEAPVIKLNEDKELQAGAVSYSYPIPEASAYDTISLNCEVKKRVVYNYLDQSASVDVPIVNNRFYMDKAGVYSIIYTAKDASGNEGKLVKSVTAMTSLPQINFSLPEHETTAAIGSYLKFNDAVSITGGSGKKIQEITATHQGIEENADSGIRFLSLGIYNITYKITDEIGMTTSKGYQINVVDSKEPILENEITYPRYFISNGKYKVNDDYCYYYENEKLNHENVTLQVEDSTGTHTYNAKEEYRPVVTNNGDIVTLTTLYKGKVLQQGKVKTILPFGTTERANAINLSNYFVGNSFTSSLESNGIRFTSTDNNMQIDFANALLSKYLNVDISQVMNMPNNSSIDITLIDSLNSKKQVTVSLIQLNNQTYFTHNNIRTRLINNNFNSALSSYSIFFENNAFSIGSTEIKIDTYDDSTKFDGFDSDRVYLSINTKNASINSSLLINNICQYGFNNNIIRDMVAPTIYAGDDLGGTREINSTYIIKPAYAADVLSPEVNFTLTVTDPNGDAVRANDNTLLENADPSKTYEITLSQYGEYYFALTAVEDSGFIQRGNRKNNFYFIRVYDETAPTLSFIETLPSKVNKGETIKFPEITYSDNISSTESLVVVRSILSPSGKTTYWFDDSYKGITLSQVGTYTFRVTVFDEAGNSASITQQIEVVEA